MPHIKICGLTEASTRDAAIGARATHLGFVFFPPSPRHLALDRAAALAAPVPPAIARVGVFVDPDDALLEAAIHHARLTVLQLHGEETPARVADVRARFGLETWKAVPVRTAPDIAATVAYVGAADRLLLDAKAPEGAPLPGGNGLRFDWAILGHARPAMPWGLSGGLTPATVAAAVRSVAAPLVDVSSGVETAPGVKSADLIRHFIKAARSA